MPDTDAEYVERVRRGLDRFDRLRRAFLAVYLALAAGLVGLWLLAAEFLQNNPQWPGVGPGFALGVGMGTAFGLLTFKVVLGLFKVTIDNRTARLMVRYYDAARAGGPDPG